MYVEINTRYGFRMAQELIAEMNFDSLTFPEDLQTVNHLLSGLLYELRQNKKEITNA